jgi:hypothetical protein
MKSLFSCRRTFLSFFAIICLTYLGHEGADVAGSIAFIAAALAGANASQGIFTKKEASGSKIDDDLPKTV